MIEHITRFHVFQLNHRLKPWQGKFPVFYDESDVKSIKNMLCVLKEYQPGIYNEKIITKRLEKMRCFDI